MDFDIDAFSQELNSFETELSANQIDYFTDRLDNSSGPVISNINSAIDAYAQLTSNINSLYTATDNYLHKVQNNIESCEADNTFEEY